MVQYQIDIISSEPNLIKERNDIKFNVTTLHALVIY